MNSFFTEKLPQEQVLQAMRYSLLAGGKRIRPVLTLEFCRLAGGFLEAALPAAAAIEMVHTYSLIHDDLPCMDNDNFRRGRLTNHKVYGEATALLAGDGLLTYAFELLGSSGMKNLAAAITSLAHAAGSYGMIGGQQLDLEYEKKEAGEALISQIHALKTGCLFKTACELGVICANGSEDMLQAAGSYAENLGLAFQLRDDILDVTGDAALMGKNTGMDENKNTFVKLYGIDKCEELIREKTEKACSAVSGYSDSEFLVWFARKLVYREF